ncbi:MAG: M48 family metallopeptidase [Oligoflexia bacterium]|nr:M48 family metallopeptidase [Oligoflexia bacterium]
MEDFVDFGNTRIEFRVKRTKRKTLGISVYPTGEVEIVAPEKAGLLRIKKLILKRAQWILEQKRLSKFTPLSEPTRQLVSGEGYYYLGRQLRLKVFEANYDSVELHDDRLILNCTFPEERELKISLLQKWYATKAQTVISERLDFHTAKFSQAKVEMIIKKMAKCWGEYHPDKKLIVFNMELIVAPLECIDYVIIHELCHVVCLHHGSDFYNLLSNRLHNWEDLKNKLETYSNGLSGLGHF